VRDTLRLARRDEVDALNALIAESADVLSRGYYSMAQIGSLITHVFGVDTQLVRDGSYFVIERDAQPVACGGWSARRTLFGGDQAKDEDDPMLNPAFESARIRAFFVRPSAARQGLGRRLLYHCEAAANAAGFSRTELMATLPGVPLYAALGYTAIESIDHVLPNGITVPFVRMGRTLR
jgi:GNAT superfamily N-acetyltransferase